MSEENLEGLVSENLKVRVVLKEQSNELQSTGTEEASAVAMETDSKGPLHSAGSSRSSTVQQPSSFAMPSVKREEYTYHYGRIAAAAAAVLGLLLLVIFVAYDAIQGRSDIEKPLSSALVVEGSDPAAVTLNDSVEAIGEGEAVDETLDNADALTLESEQSITEPDTKVGSTVGEVVEETVQAAPQSDVKVEKQSLNGASFDIPTTNLEAKPADSADQSAEVPQPKVVEEGGSKVAISEVSTQKEQVPLGTVDEASNARSATTDSVAAITGSAKAADEASGVVVERFSDDVVEARMSAQISNREPVGYLATVVRLGTPPFQTVYITTAVSNRTGQRVFYRWYREGSLEAEVPVLIRGGKDWSSYSSKNINGQMLGRWTVELETAEGEVLLRGAFDVTL